LEYEYSKSIILVKYKKRTLLKMRLENKKKREYSHHAFLKQRFDLRLSCAIADILFAYSFPESVLMSIHRYVSSDFSGPGANKLMLRDAFLRGTLSQ